MQHLLRKDLWEKDERASFLQLGLALARFLAVRTSKLAKHRWSQTAAKVINLLVYFAANDDVPSLYTLCQLKVCEYALAGAYDTRELREGLPESIADDIFATRR
jgi:hypothetical protein